MDSDQLNPRPASSRLPPVVKSLGAVSFLNDLASEMVYPLLPALVTRVLGGGALTLGVLDGAADASAALAKLWSGWVADTRGWRRPLVVLGYAVAAVARPLTALAGAGWQVVALRVADRLGKGMRTPPRDAVIADATAPEIRGRAFGFHRTMDHAGAMVGPLVATALLTLAGLSPSAVIAWAAVPSAFAVMVAWVALRREKAVADPDARGPEPRPSAADVSGRPPSPSLAPPRPPSSLLALVVVFAFARLPETLFILRLQDLGVAIGLIPMIWALLHVVRTAASYPGGWLSDRAGPGPAMLVGWLLYGMVCVGLARAGSAVVGMAWFLVFGLVAGATESAERALIAGVSGPARRGRAFGAYHAVVGVAALPGGVLFGLVYSRVSGTAALLASAALAGAIVLGALMLGRQGGRVGRTPSP
ncbi:MAG TPA: MFS transporter [Gemmatimonadales bacterium]